MKVLATSSPNDEHLYPLLPTLWALRAAGHEVLLALPLHCAANTAGTGLPVATVADETEVQVGGRPSRHATVDDLAEHIVDRYLPLSEQAMPRTVSLAESWRPDLVLCSDWEYAGPVAAAAIGVPTVLHNRGMQAHPAIASRVGEALRPVHWKWGLAGGAPDHWRIIDNCPTSLQWTAMPRHAIPSRYVGYHRPGVLPGWVFEPPEVPRVLVTLSNDPLMQDRAGLLRRITKALLPLDVEVVIETSGHIDTDRLVELPQRTRLTGGVPLSQLIPTCSVVIDDGNPGAAMTAAVSGVPQLGLPEVAGQFQHADRIAAVGAGLILPPEEASVAAITEATDTLLNELGQRAIARNLQVENDHRPPPTEVARFLHCDLMARTGTVAPPPPPPPDPTQLNPAQFNPAPFAPAQPGAAQQSPAPQNPAQPSLAHPAQAAPNRHPLNPGQPSQAQPRLPPPAGYAQITPGTQAPNAVPPNAPQPGPEAQPGTAQPNAAQPGPLVVPAVIPSTVAPIVPAQAVPGATPAGPVHPSVIPQSGTAQPGTGKATGARSPARPGIAQPQPPTPPDQSPQDHPPPPPNPVAIRPLWTPTQETPTTVVPAPAPPEQQPDDRTPQTEMDPNGWWFSCAVDTAADQDPVGGEPVHTAVR